MQTKKLRLRIRHQTSINCAVLASTTVRQSKCSNSRIMGSRLWFKRLTRSDRAEARTQLDGVRKATASRVRKDNLYLAIKARLSLKNTA